HGVPWAVFKPVRSGIARKLVSARSLWEADGRALTAGALLVLWGPVSRRSEKKVQLRKLLLRRSLPLVCTHRGSLNYALENGSFDIGVVAADGLQHQTSRFFLRRVRPARRDWLDQNEGQVLGETSAADGRRSPRWLVSPRTNRGSSSPQMARQAFGN